MDQALKRRAMISGEVQAFLGSGESWASLEGRSILVTGGTGFSEKELC